MSVLSIMDRTFNLSVRCLLVRWGVIDMKDVNQDYMEHHRDTHIFSCWECNKKFKTIEELKIHFAKVPFNKIS